MRYFSDCKDFDELKKRFRDLCKQHHPDLGGDAETMKAVNAEYEKCLKDGLKHTEDFATRMDIERELAEIVQRLITLPGVTVEICGRWIWITGDTYSVKSILKENGCRWAKKKKAWYWRSLKDRVQSRKPLSLDKIRSKYGSLEFASKPLQAIG